MFLINVLGKKIKVNSNLDLVISITILQHIDPSPLFRINKVKPTSVLLVHQNLCELLLMLALCCCQTLVVGSDKYICYKE